MDSSDIDPHLMNGTLGPHVSSPKQHRNWFEYTTAKTPNVFQWGAQPRKLRLPLEIFAPSPGDLGPVEHTVPWALPSQSPKWHLDQFRKCIVYALPVKSPFQTFNGQLVNFCVPENCR